MTMQSPVDVYIYIYRYSMYVYIGVQHCINGGAMCSRVYDAEQVTVLVRQLCIIKQGGGPQPPTRKGGASARASDSGTHRFSSSFLVGLHV